MAEFEAGIETRQQFLETEIGLLKDTVYRLTGRVFVLENFIKQEFGEVLKASVFYSQIGKLFEERERERIDDVIEDQSKINHPAERKRSITKNYGHSKSVNEISLKRRKGYSMCGRSRINSPVENMNSQEDFSSNSFGDSSQENAMAHSPEEDNCGNSSTVVIPKMEVVEELYMDFDKGGTIDHFLSDLIVNPNITTCDLDTNSHCNITISPTPPISTDYPPEQNEPSKPRGKSSFVWEYFELTEDYCKSKCVMCGCVVSRGTQKSLSTSSMRNHLKCEHKSEFEIMKSKECHKQQTELAKIANELAKVEAINSKS